MNPNIYRLGGHDINDGSTYEALFVGDIFFRQAQGKVNLTKRADNAPAYTSKERQAKTFKIRIISRSSSTDFSAAYTQLNKWFDTFEEDELTLIVKDPLDSNRQWYIKVAVEDTPKVEPDGYYLDLVAADPIWRTVTTNAPTAWAMTASGQSHDFTILGNRPARPIIKLTPTSTKSGGYASRMFRAWYNPKTTAEYNYDNFALDITDDAWDTRTLVANSSISNQINQGGGISAVATSFPVDTSVGGGLPTTGGVCMVDSEQIKYSGISAGTLTVSSGGRGWGGTTAATHADNAVLKKSVMLANGADIQVYDGVRRVSRWVSGVNTATTQVFVATDFAPGLEMTLYETLASSGAITTVQIKPTSEGIIALNLLPRKGATFMFMIGTELFTGTGVDPIKLQITGVTRATFTSSMAAHAVGDTIRWMQHAFWVCWGDLSIAATSSDSITQDETHKPMIDMDNSTNASWRYTEFFDEDGLRAVGFKREVNGRACEIVGGSHGTEEDPATVMGLIGRVYEVGGQPRANSYELNAHTFHPAGFTSITCNGDKYRETAGFSKVAGVYVGNDLTLGMASLFNESAPGSAATWTAWTQTAVAIGTKRYVQFKLKGNVAASEDNMHALEVQTITALAISSANRLQLAWSGSANNLYEIGRDSTQTPLRITNNENNEYIEVLFLGELNQTLKIDCDTERVTDLRDNTRADYSISYPPRDHIFELIPGDDGVNNITITDAGLAGMSVTFEWEDRNS